MTNINADSSNNAEGPPQIKRGRLTSFAIFEVAEYELDILQRGEEASTQLNIAIALISSSMSFVITLSTTVPTEVVKTIMIISSTVFTVSGVFLILSCYNRKTNAKSLINRIRCRMPTNEVSKENDESGN